VLHENAMEGLQKANILLVEDDDFEAKAVRRAFHKARIKNEIVRAVDGEEALAILENTHPHINVPTPLIALIDINMPKMSGLELVEIIRSKPALQNLICFMLTTSRDPGDIHQAYSSHVAGYVVKETAGQDFTRLLSLLDDYWITVELPNSPRH